MMEKRIHDLPIKERADDQYLRVYRSEVGNLNRAERRTAFGRQLVAEAHAKALQAKVNYLEQELDALEAK